MALAKSTHLRGTDKSYRHATTIDILPDDIFLEIFGFILSDRTIFEGCYHPVWGWYRLVHVCRRWRRIIFASPLRLGLRLLCTYRTPVRKGLGWWPAFPLTIDYGYHWEEYITSDDEDNIFAALEQRDRVRYIDLSVSSLLLGELIAVMKEPFPALTHLWLSCVDEDGPVIPSEFLGGSAPNLHVISFSYIPCPAIPTLLSSASDLVKLELDNIPPISFPPPEAMVACLATLTRLEDISIGLQSPTTRPDQIRLPPGTRAVLPAVTSFLFEGDSTYLDDFVARINIPRLNSIDITYTEDVDLQVAELLKFIERSNLRPSRFGHAEIFFEAGKTSFLFHHETNPNESAIAIRIASWEGLYFQVTGMTLMLSQTSAILSNVVDLDIESESSRKYGEDDRLDNIRWLELFRPFIAVKTVCISFQFAEGVARAFKEMSVEMATQVLPALKSLHLKGPFITETVEKLSDTFRACGRPLVITNAEKHYSGGSESKK